MLEYHEGIESTESEVTAMEKDAPRVILDDVHDQASCIRLMPDDLSPKIIYYDVDEKCLAVLKESNLYNPDFIDNLRSGKIPRGLPSPETLTMEQWTLVDQIIDKELKEGESQK